MPDASDLTRTTAPAEQHASASGDRDETAASPPSAGAPAAPRFGPPAAPGEVGTLGPYRVVRQLGAGGMGAVYLALDTRLDRKLALKVMLPEFAADRAAKERFLREARAAAKVSHDNVVTVYEADERQGVPYIAMQVLQGYPLDEFLKKKGTPALHHVARVAREAAAGLAAAHALGLVHRDIKPANLWLEAPAGRVKVLDFGLAKPVGTDAELTKSGAVVGTPAYMSPEQARGQKVDHRTDLFSLGAVLYRLCAGKNPFSGPSVMAVLMALGTEEPAPVRELNPAVPEALAQLIHQLLAKKPEDRPQTAAEVAKRLRVILDQMLAPPMATAAEQSTSQPVMVPSVVAAQPEDALTDAEEEADEPTEAEEEPKRKRTPERAKGGKGVWVAAGLAVLMAVVAAGVIIVIKNNDGTETKIEVPDGATVTVKDGTGKTVAQVPPAKGTPAAADPGRAAAEYALSLGGIVRVNGGWGREIKTAAELPKERFALTMVDFCCKPATDDGLKIFGQCRELMFLELGGTKVTDSGLEHLKGCAGLKCIFLAGTRVTDAGLEHLRGFQDLEQLYLDATRVTDAGLVHFKDGKWLTQLGLDQTKVTDTGLAYFHGCKNLEQLHVRKTKVTDAGVAAFHAAVPGCKIEWDGGTIEPAKK